MSIFERFGSKETGEKERKSFHPVSYRRRFSELELSGEEAGERYPEDHKIIERFVLFLKERCRARYKKALSGDLSPMRGEAQFFLSEDRMCAYACLLPPENDGEDITLEDFLGDLRYEGICYGLLEENIPEEFDRGYLHIFPVARGKPPQPGEDGKVTELFRRRKNMRLEVQNGSEVEFGEDMQLQPVRKGAVICLIRAPKPGTEGIDVTGQKLPPPEVVSARAPQGENTVIGRGGQALTASVDGILYIRDDLFCIHAQKIIDGNLDQFQGTLRISGNLYIGGNVSGGVDVEASGDIVVNGKMELARVRSTGGTIRVQKGVFGAEGKTSLSAAGQVQTPVLEWAEVDAGASVIAETISNSTIRSGGTVYAMTGRGMIVGSRIYAADSVLCLRIGNITKGRNCFSVGYPPQIPESWDRIKAELAEAQSTIERLWPPIVALRKKGSRISDDEMAILKQLIEQRELYLKRAEVLKTELKNVNKALDKKSKGRIRCEKLYPFLDVRIGRLTEEVTTIEEDCNIHVEENSIHLE